MKIRRATSSVVTKFKLGPISYEVREVAVTNGADQELYRVARIERLSGKTFRNVTYLSHPENYFETTGGAYYAILADIEQRSIQVERVTKKRKTA